MDRSKETCYKATKSVFSIYHKLHRRPCKAAKHSAFQVSHQLNKSRSYKIQVWNITHLTLFNILTYYNNNDCFCKNKYPKLNKIFCPQKKEKKCNKKADLDFFSFNSEIFEMHIWRKITHKLRQI